MADNNSKEHDKSVKDLTKVVDIQSTITSLLRGQSTLYGEIKKSIGEEINRLTKIDELRVSIKKSTEDVNSLSLRAIELEKKKITESKVLKDIEKKRIDGQEMLEDLQLSMKRHKDKVDTLDKDGLKRLREAMKNERQKISDAKINYKLQSQKLKGFSSEIKSVLSKKKSEESILSTSSEQLKNLESTDSILGSIGLKSIGWWVALDVALTLLGKIWDNFKLIDEDVFRLRKNLGLMGEQEMGVQRTARLIAREYAYIGVTINQAVDSLTALSKAFGSVSTFSEETVVMLAAFNSQLGISEETSANMLKNISAISGKHVTEAAEGMLGFAQSMSVAAGVPLPEVMSDLAHISESVRNTFRGNTVELIKATVEARRMGLSLESLGKSSEHLLNFNTSVSAEMEASLLLGKNLNMMEARRKAWAGDILGANQEILKVVKSAGDFDKMNIYQRKALAELSGKSVEELQTMLQREKNIEIVRSKGTGAAYDALMLYEKQSKMQEEMARDAGKSAEADVLKMANQAKMTVLTQQLNQMILDFGGPIMDIMQLLLKIAVVVFPKIISAVKILSPFVDLIKRGVIGILFRFSSLPIKPLLAIAGIFGKWLTPIGWVITALQVIGSTVKVVQFLWSDLSKDFANGDIGTMILKGLASVGLLGPKLIYDILLKPIVDLIDDLFGIDLANGIKKGIDDASELIGDSLGKPFKDVFDWVMSFLGGHSPSELGLRIVDGITSIGSMLFDSLVFPFKTAYENITKLFGNIPEFITTVFKRGIDFAMNLPGMGMLVKLVDRVTGGSPSTPTNSTEQIKQTSVADDTEQKVLAKLTELVDLMKSGGIVINLDGRRVSEFLATSSR